MEQAPAGRAALRRKPLRSCRASWAARCLLSALHSSSGALVPQHQSYCLACYVILSPGNIVSQPCQRPGKGSKRSGAPECSAYLGSLHAVYREAKGHESQIVDAFDDPQAQRASQPGSPKAAGEGNNRSAASKSSADPTSLHEVDRATCAGKQKQT